MGKIYKCWTVHRLTEAWYSLAQDEQNALLGKVSNCLKQVGGEAVITCNISWSNEGVGAFGVEAFPSLEAVQEHRRLLDALNWGRYIESTSYLGTEMQPM
ncbi:MAG: hypothetical protein R3E39_16070 [Anaerolineae bacterium]